MVTAIIIAVIVVALIVGTMFSLRSSAKTGMPSQDVLNRATERAKELDRQDRAEDRR